MTHQSPYFTSSLASAWIRAKHLPIHSMTLSDHLFLLVSPYCTVPCKMFLERTHDLLTGLHHFSFLFLMLLNTYKIYPVTNN